MRNEEPETLVVLDEEEKTFVDSLGWNENAGEDALTAEEIVKKDGSESRQDGSESLQDCSESWRDGNLD
ncbi:uncharacterized protein A4U43_C03F14440 [Asparagus officinalis]|uniref:Uncharacterized protein n=1 Tax=Asparagus officinalis TaxID=4686 RepID=A0A5P1FAX3_ASPOF|nr:uncharacterized protein A4U43_C03F14440 [Asparagus officinalis]